MISGKISRKRIEVGIFGNYPMNLFTEFHLHINIELIVYMFSTRNFSFLFKVGVEDSKKDRFPRWHNKQTNNNNNHNSNNNNGSPNPGQNNNQQQKKENLQNCRLCCPGGPQNKSEGKWIEG